MNKKSLLISIACTVVLTLALSIYTLISVLGVKAPEKPGNTNVFAYYRTRDNIKDLSMYKQKNMTFTYSDAENPAIIYNEEDGTYTAAAAGDVKVVVTLDDIGNTKTYKITVYEQAFDKYGMPDGSGDNEVVITSRQHLVEYAEHAAKDDSKGVRGYNVKLYNDIDLSGINWIPIGTRENPFFGSFDGNGHTIKGMNVHVTASNYDKFTATIDDSVTMYVGFFGCVDGLTPQPGFTVKGEIKNVNFEDAFVKIDHDVKSTLLTSLTDGKVFQQSGVGILAGRIYGTTIEGAEQKSTLKNCEINGYGIIANTNSGSADGLGGLVGVMLNPSIIKNYSVDVVIYNDHDAAYYTKDLDVKGNTIGGLVGSVLNKDTGATEPSIITNCDVNVVATIKADKVIAFGGAVGVLKDAEMDKVNVVADVRTNSSETNNELVYSRVGGAVYHVAGTSVVKNTTVSIDADVYAIVSGFAFNNEAEIQDSAVQYASISASHSSGFIYKNEGVIEYTSKFKGNAVKATLRGFVNSGFAYINTKTIKGYAGDTLTLIDVTINSRNAMYDPESNAYNVFSNTVGSAGFANRSYGDTDNAFISNFEVKVVINNDVNQTGLVFNLGEYEADKESILSNMKVNAVLNSAQIDKGAISTSKYMAGAVARMFGTAKVYAVEASVNVNSGVDTSKAYGVEFFGGLVARILEGGAQVTGSTASGYAYFNSSNYFANVGESEYMRYQVSLIGGLVGAISNDGLGETFGQLTVDKTDQFSMVDILTNGINLEDNKIKDLTLVVNIGQNDTALEVPEGKTKSGLTTQRFRFRSLGATVGTIYVQAGVQAGANTVSLNGTTMENVTIKSVEEDYDYQVTVDLEASSICNASVDVSLNKSYGTTNLTTFADISINGLTYIEL